MTIHSLAARFVQAKILQKSFTHRLNPNRDSQRLFTLQRWHFACGYFAIERFVRSPAAFMFHSIGSLFKFNLLLQIFDGLFTYHVLTQQGLSEANPLVRNTIHEWGTVWGIVYWKLLACVLLGLIFALRHRKYGLSFKALSVTSAVYGGFFLVALFFFVTQLTL